LIVGLHHYAATRARGAAADEMARARAAM